VTRGLRVIRSGLERQDRVVITNLQSAMIGAKVNTRAEKITASTAPAATLSTPAAAQVTLAQ
jgi:multidrug efflux system membrane fusion protein